MKKGLLAPSDGDRVALVAFLRTRNTGLIRLLPREVYDSATYHTPKKLNIRGGGAYYSFAFLTHAYGYGSDIELDHNRLTVGFAGADYGMLTNIGDTPLEEIRLDDARTRDIAGIAQPDPNQRREQHSGSSGSGRASCLTDFSTEGACQLKRTQLICSVRSLMIPATSWLPSGWFGGTRTAA